MNTRCFFRGGHFHFYFSIVIFAVAFAVCFVMFMVRSSHSYSGVREQSENMGRRERGIWSTSSNRLGQSAALQRRDRQARPLQDAPPPMTLFYSVFRAAAASHVVFLQDRISPRVWSACTVAPDVAIAALLWIRIPFDSKRNGLTSIVFFPVSLFIYMYIYIYI